VATGDLLRPHVTVSAGLAPSTVMVSSGGRPGAPGATGPTGPPGLDLHYTHNQGVPAAVWYVAHDLGKWPAVTVHDSANNELLADVHHIDQDHLTITFGAATGGRATMN
jgi:hypothetical protein